MTVNEAYVILMTVMPRLKVVSCYEYDSVFVFNTVPAGYRQTETLLNGSYSVDKSSGDIKDFKPFRMSIEEYRRGKEVTDFE